MDEILKLATLDTNTTITRLAMKNYIYLLPFALLFLFGCLKDNPPSIVLEGDFNHLIFLGEDYEDPGYVATDGKGRDITDKVVTHIPQKVEDASETGTFEVSYFVADKKGQSRSNFRYVYIGCDGEKMADTTYEGNIYTSDGTYPTQYMENLVLTFVSYNAETKEQTMEFDMTSYSPLPIKFTFTVADNGLSVSVPNQTYNGYEISPAGETINGNNGSWNSGENGGEYYFKTMYLVVAVNDNGDVNNIAIDLHAM